MQKDSEMNVQLLVLQDPVMPSQEPPPDEQKSEEDLPAVHGQDADGSETPFLSNTQHFNYERKLL